MQEPIQHYSRSQPSSPATGRSRGFGAKLVNGTGTSGGTRGGNIGGISSGKGIPLQGALHSGNGNMRPAVSGVDLQIPFRLTSADGLKTDFTNFVRGYKGALDYVW